MLNPQIKRGLAANMQVYGADKSLATTEREGYFHETLRTARRTAWRDCAYYDGRSGGTPVHGVGSIVSSRSITQTSYGFQISYMYQLWQGCYT
jgi:hypothetical protein